MRRLKGLSQQALATRLSISWRQLGKIERGEGQDLGVLRLVEIANALNTPLPSLLDPTSPATRLTPEQREWQDQVQRRISHGLDTDPQDMPKPRKRP